MLLPNLILISRFHHLVLASVPEEGAHIWENSPISDPRTIQICHSIVLGAGDSFEELVRARADELVVCGHLGNGFHERLGRAVAGQLVLKGEVADGAQQVGGLVLDASRTHGLQVIGPLLRPHVATPRQ